MATSPFCHLASSLFVILEKIASSSEGHAQSPQLTEESIWFCIYSCKTRVFHGLTLMSLPVFNLSRISLLLPLSCPLEASLCSLWLSDQSTVLLQLLSFNQNHHAKTRNIWLNHQSSCLLPRTHPTVSIGGMKQRDLSPIYPGPKHPVNILSFLLMSGWQLNLSVSLREDRPSNQ